MRATEDDVGDSLRRWREDHRAGAQGGPSRRGHRLATGNFGYSAFLGGEWDEGLAAMDAVLAEEISPHDRVIMLNNALDIRASMGESVEDGIAEIKRLGADMSGRWRLFLADTVANASLAGGDLKAARDAFLETTEIDLSQASDSLYRAARRTLWAGSNEDARTALARLEELGGYGRVEDARRATLRAGIAALEDRTSEALGLYREALTLWRGSHSVWDEALTGIDMATLLDPKEPEVAAVIASTRAILERLRAKPYLERLDAAEARAGA